MRMQIIAKTMVTILISILLVSCGALNYVVFEKKTHIIETKLTKTEIYDKYISYLSQVYNDPLTVIKLQNRESGEVVVHAKTNPAGAAYYKYILTAKMKDGAIRLTYELINNELPQMWVKSIEDEFNSIKIGFEKYLNTVDDF